METALYVQLLRLHEVEKATGLKKSSIYQKMKEGKFPTAVRLSSRAVAWRSDEIRQWQDERPRVTERG